MRRIASNHDRYWLKDASFSGRLAANSGANETMNLPYNIGG
jgi:hypothetical protein